MTRARRDTAVLAAVLACFALSGFAALLYQTAWTREFAFVFGTSELAVAAVLAGYMGGLAAGAALAARFAHRVTRPVLAYGVLELGIALSALAVPAAIGASERVLVALFGGEPEPVDGQGLAITGFRLAVAAFVLLPPTAMMGATLPLLARYAVRRAEQIGARTGLLYAVNAGGAVAGTLVAAFVLLPWLGLRLTVWTGIAANLLVFLVAAALARAVGPLPEPARAASARPVLVNRWLLPVMLVSGVVSFSYEILWTRLLGFVLGGSVYAFATMLASFLTGITLGSAVAARIAVTGARSRIGLCVCQLGVALASLAAFHSADPLVELAASWGSARGGALLAPAAIAMIVLLPAALFMGATFPFAVRALGDDPAGAPTATARVYAWNTLGAITGAVLAAFVLVPGLGFAGTLGVTLATSLALAAVVALGTAPRWIPGVAGAAATLGVALLLFPAEPERLLRFNPLLGAANRGERVYLGVGRSATVMVLDEGRYFSISTNGLPEARVPREPRVLAELTSKWLTALPVAARPEAKRMLVVGLGGGRALEHLPAGLERVDAIELEREVVRANRVIAASRARDPLSDPRVRVVVNDARGALALTSAHYDIVVSQPSHPWTAGASHLYTREFFALARSRLAPHGVFVQWIGLAFVDEALLRSLVATLGDVFRNVRVYSPPPGAAVLFLASDGPVDVEQALAESPPPANGTLWQVGLGTPEHALAALVLDARGARTFAAGATASSDDENLLQMRSPRVLGHGLDPAALRRAGAALDPLPVLAAGVDRVALVRRLLAGEASDRIGRIVAAAPEEAERLAAYGTVGLAYRQRDAGAALFRAVELDPGRVDAAFTLLKLRIDDALAAAPAVAPLLAALDGHAAAVVEGWRAWLGGDWQALETLDEILAHVPGTHVAYVEASRLRARWRMRSDEATRRGEARTLLDVSLLMAEDTADFVLRARLAVEDGDPEYALELLEHGRFQLSRSSRAREVAHDALALLQAAADGARLPAQRLDAAREAYRRALKHF